MTKTASIGPVEEIARLCFRWYQHDTPTEEGMVAVLELLGSPMSLEEMKRLDRRVRQSKAYSDTHAMLFDSWQVRFQSEPVLGEEASQQFLQALFEQFDHNLLFEQGITASTTQIKRGEVSDSQTHYPGTMPCWTLHLTCAGKALFLNENMEQEVGQGDMMLLRPEASFHCGLHPGAQEWQHHWALFQPRPHWSEFLEWQALDEGIFYLSLPEGQPQQQAESIFKELLALNNDPGPFRTDLQHNKLEELLIRAKNHAYLAREKIDERIQLACEYMMAHMAHGFRIEDVAAACNLSPSRLAHLFTEHMGVSPKSWSNNMRLQNARRLLLSNKDSIGAIARQVGYDDPSQFTRYFSKNMGCSPRQFRASFKPAVLHSFSND